MVSPACAGMIPVHRSGTQYVQREPRMRGDDPHDGGYIEDIEE